MDNEKLIELVHSHIELYDLTHSKYMDTNYKEKVWKEIGEEVKQPGFVCKARWNNIRDNYRKSLKKTFTRGRQLKAKKYKYATQLSFLKYYLHHKDSITNISKRTNCSVMKQEAPQFVEEAGENTETDIQCQEGAESYDEPQQPQKLTSSTLAPRCKFRQPETAASMLMKYILEKNEVHAGIPAQANNAVDAFLAGIAPTLKNLTPYYLNIVKTKVFSIVQEYEMVMILDKQKQTHTAPDSNDPSLQNEPEVAL